ncbi:MAG: M48 family metalloprotease [Candidatus Glassbacteria bacterium]|nr:M48 family metalloprotease [Candidatus Glassbacteria bacterium]
MRALIVWSVLILSATGRVPAAEPADAALSLKAELKGKTFFLRESYNTSPKVYCYSSVNRTCYEHRKSRLFPLNRPEQVVITDVGATPQGADNSLTVSFQHRYLGSGSIRVYNLGSSGPEILENFRRAFELAFSEGPDDGFAPFVGNVQSKLLHYIGCNHLPGKDDQEVFADVEEAERQGYHRCNICFMSTSRMPNYNLEMILGQKVAAEARYFYPLSDNKALNQKLGRVGSVVLAGWPTPLRGYKYAFQVLESDQLRAIACPGGTVFVATGMLEALETDSELEALLAREIAHIERRHGWREYKKGKTAAFWKSVAKFAVGTTVGPIAREVPAGLFSNILSSFSSMAAQIVLAGYSREYEQEADFYAVSYLMERDQRQAMYSLLQKLQYYSGVQGVVSERIKVFARYPNIDQRLSAVRSVALRKFPADLVFSGYDASGEVMAQIQFDSQCLASDGYKLFARISTTSALGKEQKIKRIGIVSGGREYRLENRENVVIFPNDEVGCAFEARVPALIDSIDRVVLKLGEVSAWKRQ